MLSLASRAIISLIITGTPLQAVTLTDFGYQNMVINGQLPIGQRPLVVIMAQFDGIPVVITSLDGENQIQLNKAATATAAVTLQITRGATSLGGIPALTTSGSTIVAVNGSFLFAGDVIAGPGIPSGSSVSSVINLARFQINSNATSTASGVTLTVTRAGATVQSLTGSTTSGSSLVSVNTLSGIQAGDVISGPGIPTVASFTHDAAYFDSLVFNPFPPVNSQSHNGCFLENSNGRFIWTRAGIIGPLQLSANERKDNYSTGFKGPHYFSNIIKKAMMTGFNFQQYDTNGDAEITDDELQIMIITNDSDVGNRPSDFTKPDGFAYGIRANKVVALSDLSDFASRCHELFHSLDATDLYGADGLSRRLTLMGGTIAPPNFTAIWHLDPWHKMQLGWSEPRIRSIHIGGIETIPAAQMLRSNSAIIYYDPARGTNEYFMLEYRTSSSPNGAGYDSQVAGNGLVVWHVQQDANRNAFSVPEVHSGPLPGQRNWRYCKKCQGLHYINDSDAPVFGQCPEGGVHSQDNNRDGGYLVVNNNPAAPGQHGWRWCHKCQGLFHGPGQAQSRCPVGGTHEQSGGASGDYSLVLNVAASPGQHDWRWCSKCQGLFFGPSVGDSDCPAGLKHDGSTSGDYAVLFGGTDRTVWSEGPVAGMPPSFSRGSSIVWTNALSPSPHLIWADGTPTQTRFVVRPFNPGDGSITIEVIAEGDTWVDFQYPGAPFFTENGKFSTPFNTFYEGVTNVGFGGVLNIKAGTSIAPGPVTKRMTLKSYGGTSTVRGQ